MIYIIIERFLSINSFPKQKREKGHRSFDLRWRKQTTTITITIALKKVFSTERETDRGKREKLILSSSRNIIHTLKKNERKQKSTFRGKIRLAQQREREKRNKWIRLLCSTRLIKRTLAFGTFVETNDNSSSSFSSSFVSLAIFTCLLNTY